MRRFTSLFVTCIKSSEPSLDVQSRIRALNDLFTQVAFYQICRSLFETDKLLFAVLITGRIMLAEGRVNADEWK